MAPPAINLAISDIPIPFSSPSKVSPRSSDEERENTDGAVDEFNAAPASATHTGKRPRGRPAGSKNKPKAPTYLSVDPQDALRSHVLEVASGTDIPSCLSAYARSRGRGVAVLHAIGSVAGVSFRQHQSNSNPLFLKGKLDIVSLSGTILPSNASTGPAGLTVLVSGPNGQVMGGPVEGRLVAEETVMVMAATFSTATYEKLPLLQEAAAAGLGRPGQELDQAPGPDPGMEDPRFQAAAGFNVNHQETSYAWFLHQQQQQQQQQHNNINGRSVYLNQ